MIYTGDALGVLRTLPDESVQCCVTSPPYWGLRDYGVECAWGLEPTLAEHIEKMVSLFRDVRRVLKKDGVLWLNLGDAYAGGSGGSGGSGAASSKQTTSQGSYHSGPRKDCAKPKDLIGLPWRIAFALQEDGWYLRSDIIWHKPNPMPESVTDRPTRAHEYIFLLTKSKSYYYDPDAIREPLAESSIARLSQNVELQEGSHRANGGAYAEPWRRRKTDSHENRTIAGFNGRWDSKEADGNNPDGANARSVWTIATKPFKKAHFATFPPEIPKRCILAGSRPGDTVLDPFAGSGTTLAVAKELGRKYIGIELNPDYVKMAEERLLGVTPALEGMALIDGADDGRPEWSADQRSWEKR